MEFDRSAVIPDVQSDLGLQYIQVLLLAVYPKTFSEEVIIIPDNLKI